MWLGVLRLSWHTEHPYLLIHSHWLASVVVAIPTSPSYHNCAIINQCQIVTGNDDPARDSTMCFQVSYTAIIVWCKKRNGSLESNTLLVWGVDIWWRFIIREFTVHEYISLVYVLHIQCTVHMAVLPVRGGVTLLISLTPQGWSGVPAGLNPRVHQDMCCWRQLPPGCESGPPYLAWKWMRKSQSSRLSYHTLCMSLLVSSYSSAFPTTYLTFVPSKETLFFAHFKVRSRMWLRKQNYVERAREWS